MSTCSDAPASKPSTTSRPGFRGGRIPNGLQFTDQGIAGEANLLRQLKVLQRDLADYQRLLWCVARQQGGQVAVSAGELAECPQEARLSSRRGPEGGIQVAALET